MPIAGFPIITSKDATPDAALHAAPYTHIGGVLSGGDGAWLFDGNIKNISSKYGTFSAAGHYVQLRVFTSFRVWSLAISNNGTASGALAITRLAQDGVTWETVSGASDRASGNYVWSVTTPVLPPGEYKFSYGTAIRTDQEWFLEQPSDAVSLVEAGDGTLYGVSGTEFVAVGTAPCTEALLDQYGVDVFTLRGVTAESIALLPSGNLVVHSKASQPVRTNRYIVPLACVVRQARDYPLHEWAAVNQITLSATEYYSGIVRIALSVDRGVSWKTWKDGAWQTLDISDVAAFTADGMSAAVLGARVAADWAALIPSGTRRLRTAYLLDAPLKVSVASVNALTITGDVYGAWERYTPYQVGWLEGGARVQITAAGSYKINWPAL